DGEHALARVFHRLLDGHRHLAGLAVAEADAAFAVADHGQRGEGELAAALDGLADAVDGDQLLDHAVVDFLFAVAVAIATPRLTFFCHVDSLIDWVCTALGRLWLWNGTLDRRRLQKNRRRPALPVPAGRQGARSSLPMLLRTAGRLRGQRRPAP